MKRKAKELQRQRQDAVKYGRNPSGYSGISGSSGRQDVQVVESVSVDSGKSSSYNPAPRYALYECNPLPMLVACCQTHYILISRLN
jgi:hypothetical protein